MSKTQTEVQQKQVLVVVAIYSAAQLSAYINTL